jgi:hypothetical protein
LREIKEKKLRKYYDMVDSRGKVLGQFELVLEYFDNMQYKIYNEGNNTLVPGNNKGMK